MAEETNSLTNLLRSGFGYAADLAGNKLFGSSAASNQSLQVEKVARGQLNGSGPVNASASLAAPSTWTEFFFGTRTGVGTDGSPLNPPANPAGTIVLSVAAGLLVWWIVKKFF